MEALIQGIAQQHILVVHQILQVKLKGPFLKAITHQGIQVTTHHQPPTKSESKHSVLTPEQRKHIQTLVKSIKKRKIDTKPTKKSESTTSETPSKHKSPVESKDLPPPPNTPFSSVTRDNPSPAPPPSEDIDSGPPSEHSEVISLPPAQEALQVQILPPLGVLVQIGPPVLIPPWVL